MAVVSLRIGGRDYQVACDNGQEEHLRLLGDEVDDRLQQLVYQMKGNPGEAMSLLLTALMMADELLDKKQESQGSTPQRPSEQEQRMIEMESAMAVTLDEIAQRLEKIAEAV